MTNPTITRMRIRKSEAERKTKELDTMVRAGIVLLNNTLDPYAYDRALLDVDLAATTVMQVRDMVKEMREQKVLIKQLSEDLGE